jgi:hypothetical protein
MAGKTYNWKLYDVGGAVSNLDFSIRYLIVDLQTSVDRWAINLICIISPSELFHQRPTWVPYFDDGKYIALAHC